MYQYAQNKYLPENVYLRSKESTISLIISDSEVKFSVLAFM